MPKRLYTRRITLLLNIHVDPLGILCYGTTIHENLLEGVEQSKTRGFFPLVSLSKKKRRNFIHLDVLFKLICMKNRTNCITGIIRFLFFSFSCGLTLIWPCFSIPVFFQFMWTKHRGSQKSYVSKCSILHVHSYPIPVFFLSLGL